MLDIVTPAAVVKPDDHNTGGNARTWNVHADRINVTWCKGAPDIIRCGEYLLDAKTELQPDAFNAMVKTKLVFDASVARKLMLIASNSILCAHGHKLPPC